MADHRDSNAVSPNRRAFTLIEMALSMSLVGIVLISLGTMLALTMEAAPQPDDPATITRDAAFPLDLITEEISSAVSIVSVSPHAIRFRTADRNGDDLPETITYEWSGKEGTPLTRTINAEKPVDLIQSVFDVDFSATLQTHSLTTTGAGSSTNFDHELSANTSLLGGIVAAMNSRAELLRTGEGFFQALPLNAVPNDALYWIPEYAEIRLERNQHGGRVRVELRVLSGQNPSGISLASQVINTSDLGGESWHRIPVGGTIKLPPDTQIGVMVVCLSGNNSFRTRVFQQFLFPSNPASRYTNDGGNSWSGSVTTRLGFRFRGTYFLIGKQETTSQTTASAIRIRVQPGPTPATSVSTMVDLPAPVRYGQ